MRKENEYANPLTAWEIRLFLDTHPNDRRALEAYRSLCSEGCAEGGYACVPQSEYTPTRWNWVDDPWPWDYEANCQITQREPANCYRHDHYAKNHCPGGEN